MFVVLAAVELSTYGIAPSLLDTTIELDFSVPEHVIFVGIVMCETPDCWACDTADIEVYTPDVAHLDGSRSEPAANIESGEPEDVEVSAE